MAYQPYTLPAVEDLARMAPDNMQAVLQGAPPQLQAEAMRRVRAARDMQNQAFLGMTILRYAPCPAIGQATPFSAGYTQGGTMTFNLPQTVAGVLEALIFEVQITFTYTPAGASPAIAVNAAAPWNVIENVQTRYGTGIMDHGYPFYNTLIDGVGRGYGRTMGDVVPTGLRNVPGIQSELRNSLTINSGVNTWRFLFRVDRNPLNDDAVPGLLPITGATQSTITLRAPNSFIGNDPLIHPIKTNGTIAIDPTQSSVSIYAEYRDGSTLASVQPLLAPDLQGEPTYQTTMEPELRLLTANSWNRARVGSVGQIYYMFATVIDGLQSDVFSSYGNLNGFNLTRDEAGQDYLEAFGFPTTTPKKLFFSRVRRQFQQDWPEGVIPWIVAPGYNTNNASNRAGRSILNTSVGAWANVYHGYHLNALGVPATTGINPRVVTFIGNVNPQGLAVIG